MTILGRNQLVQVFENPVRAFFHFSAPFFNLTDVTVIASEYKEEQSYMIIRLQRKEKKVKVGR